MHEHLGVIAIGLSSFALGWSLRTLFDMYGPDRKKK